MHRLGTGLVALGALLAAIPLKSTALICSVPRTTLQQDYEQADAIFVGETIGCASGRPANSGWCDDYRYKVRVVDTLKSSTLVDDAFINIQASPPMGCSPALVDDQQFLIFLDSDRNLMAPTTSLAGGRPTTLKTRRRLAIITAYRDGVSSDLAQPWYFSDFLFSCHLTQDLINARLSFVYNYGPTGVQLSTGSGETIWDENGVPTKEVSWKSTSPDKTADPFATPPDLSKRRVSARIIFSDLPDTVDNSAKIVIGEQQWSLETLRETLERKHADPYELVLERIRGDAAMEILQSLDDSAGILLTVKAITRDDESAIVSTRTEEIRTLGTQLGDARSSFLACVDGTKRRPPPLIRVE